MAKKHSLALLLSAIIIVVIFIRNQIMPPSLTNINPQYIMYSLVTDPSDISGSSRKPFDASHLLKQHRYIKASDSRVIDLDHQPIKELDEMLIYDIRENLPNSPPFAALKNLHISQFEKEIKNKVRWEYLYSGFATNSNRKKPDYDDFKFYITVNNENYIIIVQRSKSDGEYSYHISDQYTEIKDALTYPKYLLQKSAQIKLGRI